MFVAALFAVSLVGAQVACSKSDGGSAGAKGAAGETGAAAEAPKSAMTHDEFVKVEVDSECARLKAGETIDTLDDRRQEALGAVHRSKQDYLRALGAFGDDATRKEIETKEAECRKAAGWHQVTADDGTVSWEK